MLERNAWFPSHIVATVDNCRDAIAIINEKKPQLIFMDIELKDGSSFSIFPHLTYHDFKIIFTTAFDKFAIKAFKYSAIDYLLKPLDNEEFKYALEQYMKVSSSLSEKDKLENAAEVYNPHSPWPTHRIAIRKNDEIYFEKLENIIAMKAEGSYTDIYTNDNCKHTATKGLGFFEELVEGVDSFIRIHHATIINLDYIKSLHYPKNSSNAFVMMKDNHAHEVSSRKLPIIKKMLQI